MNDHLIHPPDQDLIIIMLEVMCKGAETVLYCPSFVFTIFTYLKNGGKLPVTMGKPDNYYLPIGKSSVYQLGFLKVEVNF